MLNRLFQRQGVLKQRARITPETVEHGERREGQAAIDSWLRHDGLDSAGRFLRDSEVL